MKNTLRVQTAERVSHRDASDNYVFQRSLLAYHEAAKLVRGDVLEIGTGSGYGAEIVAPRADSFVSIDKHNKAELPTSSLVRKCCTDKPDAAEAITAEGTVPPMESVCQGSVPNVQYLRATVPPLPFADGSFDTVISFQVIEHVRRDRELVAEIRRVLRPGGRLIISTPNIAMSLTRNPWHVREYTVDGFARLLEEAFDSVEKFGVFGRGNVMEYYDNNRRSVARVARWDILGMRNWLPRWLLKMPYDVLNRINRRRLLAADKGLTTGIGMEDYYLAPVAEGCFDLFYVAGEADSTAGQIPG